MGATCELAIPITAEFEGDKYTNDPADPGGPTKCGITLKWAQECHLDVDHDGDVDVDDIRALDWTTAIPAYKSKIWDALDLSKLNAQEVGTKLFDLSVNLGPTRAVRYFQRALNLCGFSIREDGTLGPLTFGALNSVTPRKLLLEVCYIQGLHYRAWCDKKGDREKYRKGLARRASWPFWDLNRNGII